MKLHFSKRARTDLEHIREWLSRDASPEVAAEQLSRISAALRYLKDFPEIAPLETGTVRRTHVGRAPYLIFYRIQTSGLVILRIRHDREARDS